MLTVIGLLCIRNNGATCFDSFGVEHIPREIGVLLVIEICRQILFRKQAYDSIVC